MQYQRKLLLSFMALGLLLHCGIPLANAQTAQQIAQNAFGSTVLLVMEDANQIEPLHTEWTRWSKRGRGNRW